MRSGYSTCARRRRGPSVAKNVSRHNDERGPNVTGNANQQGPTQALHIPRHHPDEMRAHNLQQPCQVPVDDLRGIVTDTDPYALSAISN